MVLFLYIIIICYLPILDEFLPKTDFGEGIPDIGPYRIGIFLLLLSFIIHAAIKKDIRLGHGWILTLAVFYAIVICSILWSSYSYNSFILQELFNSVFIPFFLALVAINLFSKEENTDRYVRQITFVAFILSIISVIQMIVGLLSGKIEIRAAATFGNPNQLAIFIVLSIPCLLYALEKGLVTRWVGWLYSLSVIIGVICTVSRKGIITMVICYLLYCFLRKNYHRFIRLLVVFSLLTVAVSSYSVITQRFEKDEFLFHLNDKWQMTKAGWSMFKSSPFIGLGYEGYYENFGRFYPNAYKRKYDAHNIFITTVANYGLLGTVPFLMIFLYPLSIAVKILRANDSKRRDLYGVNMSVLCISIIISFIIIGWFSGGLFYNYFIMALFYTNVSLLMAIDPKTIHATEPIYIEEY